MKNKPTTSANIELHVQKGEGGVGRETKFYFNDFVQIFEFPSEDILQNNKPRIQANQASCVTGSLASSNDLISRIRKHYDGEMMNLYEGVLERYGIDLAGCVDISSKKPISFWT